MHIGKYERKRFDEKQKSFPFGKQLDGVEKTHINFHFKVKYGIKYAIKMSYTL